MAEEAPPAYQQLTKIQGMAAMSAACFSSDGSSLAVSSADRTCSLHTLRPDGTTERSLTFSHPKGVSDISWCTEPSLSHLLVSCCDDGIVRVWDSKSNSCVREFVGHEGWVMSARFNGKGTMIVSGGFDGIARVWSMSSGTLISKLEGHKDPISSVDFHQPEGQFIATGGYDGFCKVWDSMSSKSTVTLFDANSCPAVGSVRFSPNGKYVLTALLDSTLKLWDHSTTDLIRSYSGHKNEEFCTVPCFSTTKGRLVVCGSEDRCVYLWDLNTQNVVQKLEGHTGKVLACCTHPTLNIIASCGSDGDHAVILWKD